MYAKDISKKIKSSLHSRMKDGLYVSGRCPFGYQKDLTNNAFQQIKNDDFNINPILFHKTIVDRSKRIYCQ